MHRTYWRGGHEALGKWWLRRRGGGHLRGDRGARTRLFLEGYGNVPLPPAVPLLSFPPSSLLLPCFILRMKYL